MTDKYDELDDFLSKADMVQRQVRDLADGTLSPEDVKLPGQDNWAYAEAASKKKAKALAAAKNDSVEHAKALALHKRWDSQKASRLSEEERDRWWKFARMQFGEGGVNGPAPPSPPPPAAQEGGAAPPGSALPDSRWRWGSKGAIDYSWWEKYAVNPDDEVTVAEAKRLEEEAERRQNEAFEKANPGFCMSFKKDELEREANDRAKAARAGALKEEGNAFFKSGDIPGALGRYHEALRLMPFNSAVINNIANAHLAGEDWGAAVEFSTRALHIEAEGGAAGVKALFRRATAHLHLKDYPSAIRDLALAAAGDPGNSQVASALVAARSAQAECEKEALVAAGVTPSPPSLAPDGMPSSGAITDSVALVDMALPDLLTRSLARIKALPSLPLESPQRGNELRALSRELRVLAARVDGDDARVRVRTCGLLQEASLALQGFVLGVMIGGGGGGGGGAASPPSTSHDGALSTMAAMASLLLMLTATLPNPRNRTLLRTPSSEEATSALAATTFTPPPSDTALGSALTLLSAEDEVLAEGFTRAYGCAKGVGEVKVWLYQLLHPTALFIEAYSRPASADPMGRASLSRHAYIAEGGITGRLAMALEGIKGAGGGDLSIGCIETLHATASTLQFLAAFDHSAGLLSALVVPVVEGGGGGNSSSSSSSSSGSSSSSSKAKAGGGGPAFPSPHHPVTPSSSVALSGPFAPMVEAVVRAVEGLAGLKGRANPLPALLQAIIVLITRSMLQESILHSPPMLACVGAVSNLIAHEPFAAHVLKATGSAEKVDAGSPQNFPLLPLLELMRLPFRPTGKEAATAWTTVRAAAAAALANSVAPAIPSVALALEAIAITPQALHSLLTILREGPGEGKSNLCSRTSLLLGRVAAAPSAEAALKTPKMVGGVLEVLKAAVARQGVIQGVKEGGGGGDATTEEANGGIMDGMLRCLAVSVSDPGVAKEVLGKGGCASICAALATAQATLVLGYAGKRSRGVGMGNGLKALISLCDVEGGGDTLFKEGACEAFNAAILCPGRDSDPSSPTVRKNAAVGVAKLAKHPACYEKLKAGRAIEVILSLKELH